MSLPTTIVDGKGTRVEAHVTKEHALLVTTAERTVSQISDAELTAKKLFFEFFRRESDNSRDLTVDGSGTPQHFVLKAATTAVRWVEMLRIIIEGNNFDLSASGDFRRWGLVAVAPGLTNGIELFVNQGGVLSKVFYDPVKNMGDLFYYQSSYENFVNAVDSQADFLSVDIAMPRDVTLPLGVDDSLTAVVNDNLVDADFLKFQILARGYQEII